MSCSETKRSLSQYMDDDLPSPIRQAAEAHLDSCPVCRAELAELRDLRSSLRQIQRPAAPAELALAINDALMIEAAARRQSPTLSLRKQLLAWVEPRLMPYSIGSLASVLLFTAMLFGLRPHFEALRDAARRQNQILVVNAGYDLNRPVTPEDYSARRAPFAEQSPSLNPGGALAKLTGNYARPRSGEEGDDMIVVADVFSNGAASLADVVQAPRDRQMLADLEVALRQNAAFVPASLDRRPDTMRVVFSVQKVDVRDRSF
ncbi:MAG TPA: zf-HC2 domain-containing protein [Pyrinomonadaceae bacterium]|nr:zf-HC2 domain-containing protein [Pyrinomonadaceae bacterium]